MIHGIGTDIVRVERMQRSLDRFGERFAARVLTPAELEDFRRSLRPAHFLARRFAAKEAAAKALGTGFVRGLRLRDIGVGHDADGKPVLVFHGAAEALLRKQHIHAAHLTLADETDYAVAFVLLEARR
ncbi:MAG TPA: holo-ACP synthase [Burkholderiales bacterium]